MNKMIYSKRIKICKNYNWTCQWCDYKNSRDLNNRTKKLHVHHIDLNGKNNKDENLILLCRVCHYKFHSLIKEQKRYEKYRKMFTNYTNSNSKD